MKARISQPETSWPPCSCGTSHPPDCKPLESALAKKWVSLTKALNVGLSFVPPGTIKSAETLTPTVHKIFGQALEETNVKTCPWRGCEASTADPAEYSRHLADAHGKPAKCEVEDDLGYCGISLVGYDMHYHLEVKHGLICTDSKT